MNKLIIARDRFFFFILMLLLVYTGYAQEYNFRNLTINQGLPSAYVADVAEDEKGYLWFATEKGICRYDGKEFKIYTAKNGFHETGAYRIFKDRNKQLWFISMGWKLYKLTGDSLRLYFPDRRFQWLNEDNNGTMCAAMRTGELLYFNDTLILKQTATPSYMLYYLKILKQDKGILLTNNDTLLYLHKGKFTPLKLHKNPNFHTRFYQLSDGRVLICDVVGVHLFNIEDLSTRLILPLTGNEIFGCFEDSVSGDVWFASGQGILRFRKGIIREGLAEKYLEGTRVGSIYRSRDGTMWFTTHGNGVYFSNFNSVHFSMGVGLQKNSVLRLRKQGHHIIAFPAFGAISQFSNRKLIRTYPNTQGQFASVQKEEGTIYITTKDRFMKIENGEPMPLEIPTVNNFERSQYNLGYTDKNNRIYYTRVWDRRVLLYDKQKGFYDFLGQQIQDSIRNLLVKNKYLNYPKILDDSMFYFFENNGLVSIGIKNGRLVFHFDDTYASQINDFIFLPDQSRVVATQTRGLCIANTSGYHFYNQSNGLPSDYVNRVYFKAGVLWACTSKGLVKIVLNNKYLPERFYTLNASNILISDEVSDLAIDGNDFYVASNEGVSLFNQKDISFLTYIPPVYIQNTEVNDRDTVLSEGANLPYYLNDISIGFRVLALTGENVLYKYRLEGADEVYHISKLDNIKYARLEPGNYRFTVFAKTGNSDWNPVPAQLSFNIQPPFWLRWWFKLLVIAFFIACLYFSVRYIIHSNRRKDTIKRKIIESELKAIRLHMNPHFIFNTLNSLQSYILSNKAIEANNYLSIFSKLIRLIMQYAQLKEITLAEETEFLNMYIELEQLRFEEKFSFQLVIDPTIEEASTFIPPLILQPFVENSIKYGLANKKSKGNLSVSIERLEGYLHCIIEDDGIGRAEAAGIKKKSLQNYASTGIHFTEERLRLLAPKGDQKDLILIHDIYDHENKPCGTKVELFIPLLH